ncbi:MAG: porin [Roseiarcus sp.]|jgi:hypothetical protein
MTLMKSLLLGSAAALVTVAAAQAADLPTKKGAPAAEYVRICHVTANGTPITGFVLPGSDTCFKISGVVYANYSIGNVADHYTYLTSGGVGAGVYTGVIKATDRSDIGLGARGQVNFEAVNNTALGPLYSTVQAQGNYYIGGIGGDNGSGAGVGLPSNGFRLDDAYINVAGITAGIHGSFYDYLTGISYWDDLISPDHTGGQGTPLLAYTASFGGGISLTLSVERPEILNDFVDTAPAGVRAPDFVAAIDVKQGWGNAHLAGVAHNVRQDNGSGGASSIDQWGYGIIGGVTVNLPMLGAGGDVKVQGVWTHEAIDYSGLTSPGFVGNTMNANGTQVVLGSAYYDTTNAAWSKPTAWSLAGAVDIPVGPTLVITPEISYGQVSWSDNPVQISKNTEQWMGGFTTVWTPVKNLSFALDLLYGSTHQDRPTNWNTTSTGTPWKANSDGFNGRLTVARTF